MGWRKNRAFTPHKGSQGKGLTSIICFLPSSWSILLDPGSFETAVVIL